MAVPLPEVHSLAECVSFPQTVMPFVSEFLALPTRLLEAGQDVDTLKEVYFTTNPFVTAIAFALLLCPLFLVTSEIFRNWSQVDRVWSILPAVYNVHFAVWARATGISSQRLDTIALVTILWSLRLTFNYWRKGGYQWGSEDYRWQIIRSKINNGFLFFLLNVVFICVVQSLLLALITAPTYVFLVVSQVHGHEEFGIPDLVFSRLMFFFIVIELLADQQQWSFQRAKGEYLKTARIPDRYKGRYTQEDLDRGFVVSGLWSWCRHPNFAAEQAIWLTLYIWSCYITQTYVNWTGIGVLGYLLIFQGSTPLTESISAAKYPEYVEYQARVGRFIPRLSVEAKGSHVAEGSKKKNKSTLSEVDQAEQTAEGKKTN
ncbi:hypothetical protein ASPZODRAFT_87589 [Penicilliopsis zonata CBS 506.65]|uniref:Steroid 5-alpha reductase C-terminal domain-containing protein n=1 Tax=Penicilliopsis zonata CBS 506.65 TaxID=1073090 RepID=A0A1L9SW62_9EURO|nr:hypothetical protein ASPZODRAFT_87589 [Penicilliopsis zonata CBS 506.65]OJJ51341.1 hypothetical protein ASPZODRAFT_87589 [Penicilliopsis zonata CBS 506.65]